MNKLLWLCGIVAFTVVSCTEGNWGKVKEKDALGMYDSVLIGRDPGFSSRLTEDYWMLYKNGTVTKCTRSIFASDDGKDTVRTVQYQYDWGQTGVKYSSEFKKLMGLFKVHDAE